MTMNIKNIIPLLTFAALPMGAMAQDGLKSGLNKSDMDLTVQPGNDFYQYACGGWMKHNPLPAAYSRYGSFDMLAENNNQRINSILQELLNGTGYAKGSIEQKLSDFYKLAMDSTRRNNEGTAPIKPLLKEMDKATTVDKLKAVQLRHAIFGYGVPMRMGFGADEKNAAQNILNISQGGMALGQKEYYLDNDEATKTIREAYKKFIVRMFTICGYGKTANQAMTDIMKVETALAQASKSRTELRDVEANYNKMTMDLFEKNYPHLGVKQLMLAEGVKADCLSELVVGQPGFMAEADKLFAGLSPRELRHYMQWDVMLSASGYLSDAMAEANFDFFGRTMRGRQEDYPRWKRATSQVESQMGEALGRIYVQKYFPAAAKERMLALVKQLQTSLAERIGEQTWMDDATKAAAIEKLNTFYVKVGYPDKWTDLSALNIDPSKSYYENVQAARLFWKKLDIEKKAGKPVDRDEWFMYPQTVNAYYNPTTNEICFPAGILQPPFFNMEADDAFNYGAIGVVIGHEMTHGFDDQGRHYDKNGNMTDWWTAADEANFAARAGKYADFFSAIKVLPDLNANGTLTLGENIADHGGLQVAYNAFVNATRGKELQTIDGFTPAQRFFLAYSGVWAGNITDKEIRSRTKSDPHSLGRWRVNGALPHIDAWYDAFGIKADDKMYLPKEQRLQLW